MNIPLLDLKAEYLEIKPDIDTAISRVLNSARFILGEEVDSFEAEFAAFCKAKYAIGVGSGTDALLLALLALDIGPGDEVITTPMTFIATAEAISLRGAKPVFVDVDLKTHNVDPARLEAAITPRTKAIIPVHLHGQPAEMDPILEMARQHRLAVIEDAAQAHGGEYKGRSVGTLANLACFSFYPGKNIGAYGDAGMITTNDPDLAAKVRLLRDHGRTSKYEHQLLGFNWRIDALQAAILHVKLAHLAAWNQRRQEIAAQYNLLLKGTSVSAPVVPDGIKSVWHHYAVDLGKRDLVQAKLKADGIETGVHYPIPLHLQPAYGFLGHHEGDFPNAERIAQTTLSLPIYPTLDNSKVQAIVESLLDAI
ncbi:MAG TPA: DegT/DnrJ/EryC1/StrS family aminotransferase [Anaerolineales bacterium]|jgi:dTDP-4-amino-4,6-dideoxygalactose transaminase|nr:DegT/DnrJ/EryC1/StrS family aminotransferase [Anaerolineales bacterium]